MTASEVSATRLTLDPRLLDLLRRRLPEVATHTITAVTDEVPSYAGAFGGPMGDNIENAVQMALAGFLAPGRPRRPDHRPRDAPVPGARGRLRTGPRRGAQRAERRRPALGVPRGGPRGLARARRDRGRVGGACRHARVLRRAGLRLHRRAVRGLGRRPRRRARDERAGATALPRPSRTRAAARRPGRRPPRRRRARRLDPAEDADRRGRAQRPGAPGARACSTRAPSPPSGSRSACRRG